LDGFIVVSSIIDMSFSNVNLGAVRILRLLRTLRPLRFVSHNLNMKIVVNALLQSVGAIFNVLVVVCLVWLMFAILG
jgi:ribosome maturation protein Sdo1